MNKGYQCYAILDLSIFILYQIEFHRKIDIKSILSHINENAYAHCKVFTDRQTDRQTERYFIDRKKVITDLFIIEIRDIRDICICIYKIVNLLK